MCDKDARRPYFGDFAKSINEFGDDRRKNPLGIVSGPISFFASLPASLFANSSILTAFLASMSCIAAQKDAWRPQTHLE
jgi:hypothetical protein